MNIVPNGTLDQLVVPCTCQQHIISHVHIFHGYISEPLKPSYITEVSILESEIHIFQRTSNLQGKQLANYGYSYLILLNDHFRELFNDDLSYGSVIISFCNQLSLLCESLVLKVRSFSSQVLRAFCCLFRIIRTFGYNNLKEKEELDYI